MEKGFLGRTQLLAVEVDGADKGDVATALRSITTLP